MGPDHVCLRVTQVWRDCWDTDTRRLGKITERPVPCPVHSSMYNSSLACSVCVLLMDVTAHQVERFCYFICLQADTKTHSFIRQTSHKESTVCAHTKYFIYSISVRGKSDYLMWGYMRFLPIVSLLPRVDAGWYAPS